MSPPAQCEPGVQATQPVAGPLIQNPGAQLLAVMRTSSKRSVRLRAEVETRQRHNAVESSALAGNGVSGAKIKAVEELRLNSRVVWRDPLWHAVLPAATLWYTVLGAGSKTLEAYANEK